jgi:hypothetical protein
MVVFRLAHNENYEHTVAFDIEISEPYVNYSYTIYTYQAG